MSLESRFSLPGLYEASCFVDTSSQFALFMGVLRIAALDETDLG